MTSRTSVHVGKGLRLTRLNASIAITNENCSLLISPSSADLVKSLRRRPGPLRCSRPVSACGSLSYRRSIPLRRSTTDCHWIFSCQGCSGFDVSGLLPFGSDDISLILFSECELHVSGSHIRELSEPLYRSSSSSKSSRSSSSSSS